MKSDQFEHHMNNNTNTYELKSVADPGFSRGGEPTPKSAIFCQKLHENERIWGEGEGGAGTSLALPLGSANESYESLWSFIKNSLFS